MKRCAYPVAVGSQIPREDTNGLGVPSLSVLMCEVTGDRTQTWGLGRTRGIRIENKMFDVVVFAELLAGLGP